MHFLFRNRHTGLRVGLVAAGLAAVAAYAETHWEMPGPAMHRCLADPARYDGHRVWFGPSRVTRVDAGGFEISNTADLPAYVRAPAGTVREDEQVVLRGTFRREGHVDLDPEGEGYALRRSPGGLEKRLGMFAVSLGIMGYLGWRFFRAFRIERGQLTLKSR